MIGDDANKLIDDFSDDWPLSSPSIESFLDAYRQYHDAVDDKIGWSRALIADSVFEFCALKRFGFSTIGEPLPPLMDRALDAGIDFYYGDWWHVKNIRQWCIDRSLDEWKTAYELDRARVLENPSKLEPWRRTLSRQIYIGLVQDASERLAKICDWFDTTMQPEYSGVHHETELTTIVLASHLRSKPMPDIGKLVDKIANSKRKTAKAILRLIQACFDVNQEEFSIVLPEAIDLYYKAREPGIVSDLIAIDESSIVHIAKSKGLVIPKLSKKQQLAIMTAESIGLEVKA